MSQTKITDLDPAASVTLSDVLVVVDMSGTPTTKKVTLETVQSALVGSDVVAETVNWAPTASPDGTSKSIQKTVTTTSAVNTTAVSVAIPDESLVLLSATVIGRSAADGNFKRDITAAWSRTAGTITERSTPAADANFAGNPVGWDAFWVLSGTNALARVKGGTDSTAWSVMATAQVISKTASVVYDPAVLALTGWWRANFTASPWTPVASAGTSGANGNLAEATNPPATGAAQNSLVPASFDGVNDLLTSPNAMSTFINAASGSIAVLFYAATAAAPGAGVYDDEPIFCDSSANVAIGFSTSGVRAGFYDSGASWKTTAYVACATGGWHLAQMKWDHANIYLRVDSGAWISVAAVDVAIQTGLLRLGTNYNTADFDGRILEVMTSDVTLADATFTSIVSYVNSRYALAL